MHRTIVDDCRNAHVFGIENEDRTKLPIEFKVLISLRKLAHGNFWDDIIEIMKGHESTIGSIFHLFVTGLCIIF